MSQDSSHANRSTDITNLSIVKLFFFFLIVIAIQVAAGYFTYRAFNRWEDRSSFGGMFGAVGTLFSGLAFAGVVYAILLQRRDLELQRKELEMTREELKRSAEAQERSEQALIEQARLMGLTAKLTAKNFLAEVYRNRIEFLSKQGREHQQERNKWSEIIRDLEGLTQEFEEHQNGIQRDLPPPNNSFNPTPR
jgi:hypothetical protein